MTTPGYYDWLMLLAILAGPLVGIWVTRFVDKTNEESGRRWGVFEALIKTRGLELSPEHVSNLNMIPLLFSKEARVSITYSALMQALNDPALASENSEVSSPAIVRVNNSRQDLVAAIGRSVGANLPDGVLERLGYAPSAWSTEYNEGQRLRRDFIDVIAGRKAMHMIAGVWDFQHPGTASTPLDNEAPPLPGPNQIQNSEATP